jgi:hypothetical protein
LTIHFPGHAATGRDRECGYRRRRNDDKEFFMKTRMKSVCGSGCDDQDCIGFKLGKVRENVGRDIPQFKAAELATAHGIDCPTLKRFTKKHMFRDDVDAVLRGEQVLHPLAITIEYDQCDEKVLMSPKPGHEDALQYMVDAIEKSARRVCDEIQ